MRKNRYEALKCFYISTFLTYFKYFFKSHNNLFTLEKSDDHNKVKNADTMFEFDF